MLKKMSYYFPNLKECWILFLLILAGMFASGILVSETAELSGITDTALHSKPNAWTLPVSSIIGYIPVLLYIRFKGHGEMTIHPERYHEPWGKFDYGHFGSMPLAVFAILSISGLAALIVLTDAISGILPEMPDWVKHSFESLQSDPLPSIVSTVIIAPLFEEFLCRGVMLRGLLRNYCPLKAIAWSAVFFALMHMNLWQSIPAFLFGLWFGWLYYKTHSLKTVMGLHALNNATSLAIFHFSEADLDDSIRTVIGNDTLYIFVLLTSIIILCLSIFTIKKHIPSYECDKTT